MKKAKRATDKAKKILKQFKDMDILVCHQPPYGILDKVSSRYNPPKNWIGKRAGSKIILDYVKKVQPRYVFCGHIHEGEGVKKIGKSEVYNLGVGGHKIVEIQNP
jgi:Icc-related predicted phosphoesterase